MTATPKKWAHDPLANDLAEHLRGATDRMVWTNMQMGPSGSPRPDVYTMEMSYSAPRPISYEVKISEADLRGDVTSGKWQTYLPFSSGVYFAFPAGMVPHELVPRECGIILRHAECWRSARKPVLSSVTLSQNVMLKLLIDGMHRDRREARLRVANEYAAQAKVRKRHGEEIAEALRDIGQAKMLAKLDRDTARQELEAQRKRLEQEREDMRHAEASLLSHVARLLEIQVPDNPRSMVRHLERVLHDRVKALNADQRIQDALQEARRLLGYAQNMVDHLTPPAPAEPSPEAEAGP